MTQGQSKGAFLGAGALALALAWATGCGGAAPSELLEGTGAESTTDGGVSTNDSGSRDAGGGPDAQDGATGGDQGVHCPNSGYCPVPGEVCCRTDQGDTCVAAGSCSGLSIPCDDSTDCASAGMPGTVCCLTNGMNGVASNVACVAPSQCVASQGKTPVCDKGGANVCATGQSCQPSEQALPGFYICR